jgi:hypothetical protein
VTEEGKAEMERRKSTCDPVELNRRLNEGVERLLKLNWEKGRVKRPSGQDAGQAEAV